MKAVTTPGLASKLPWRNLVGLIGLMVVALFLSACDTDAGVITKPELTLTLDQPSFPDGGGEVTLTAKVTKGKATSVTFKAEPALEIPAATEDNGTFVTKVRVTMTTKFTAQATGSAGSGDVTEPKTVTVAPSEPKNDPVAPDATAVLKGFTTLELAVGTPVGVAVTVATIPGVTGQVVGDVQAEVVETSKGTVTIKAGTNKLEFSYKPKSGARGSDSFAYTVLRTGRPDQGKIDIFLADLEPVNLELATELDDINDTTKRNIILVNDVRCTVSPCIRLENSQVLMGVGSLVVDGVTITNASATKPKIIANIPGTRRSGEAPATDGSFGETKVIEIADDTTLEGIEITSDSTDERSSYFTAIIGLTNGSSPDTDNGTGNLISGDITINNVTISRSNGKPIYMKYDEAATNFGNYNLFIENLTLKDANDTMVIGNAKTLVIKNSDIELSQPAGNNAGSRPFGDNAGTQIFTTTSSRVTLDDVNVMMESTEYEINDTGVRNNAVPFEIVSKNTATTLVVKNCDITFGDILSGADSAAFKVKGDGTGVVTITTSESINNTSKEGSSNAPVINPVGTVNGTIQRK